jgi:hypothetical protein
MGSLNSTLESRITVSRIKMVGSTPTECVVKLNEVLDHEMEICCASRCLSGQMKGCLTRSQYITALISIMFFIIVYTGFDKILLLKSYQDLASEDPCCIYLSS